MIVRSKKISLQDFRREIQDQDYPLLFTKKEIRKKNPGSLAARYLIKKILLEELGSYSFLSVEILNNDSGEPVLGLCDQKIHETFKDYTISCSISHSRAYAAALVVIQKNNDH